MSSNLIDAVRRRGLSYIELIVVLVVMGILASAAIVGGQKVVLRIDNARTIVEIHRMDEAIDQFCFTFGDYPPDFHDAAAVRRFLKRAFPACPPENYPNFDKQSPASALYYWLAGPNGRGFSGNPKNPFDDDHRRFGPFYKFKPEQLRHVDGVWQYYPVWVQNGAPYVYFRAAKDGYDHHPRWVPGAPYRESNTEAWINSCGYQIICAGADGKFGGGCHYPDGEDYDKFNADDITNFSEGTIESSQSKARKQ